MLNVPINVSCRGRNGNGTPQMPTSAVSAFVVYQYVRTVVGIDLDEARTVATITLLAIGLTVLVVASRPIQPWKVGLAVAMGASYVGIAAVPFLRDFFELSFTSSVEAWIAAAIGAGVASLVVLATPVVLGLDSRYRGDGDASTRPDEARDVGYGVGT